MVIIVSFSLKNLSQDCLFAGQLRRRWTNRSGRFRGRLQSDGQENRTNRRSQKGSHIQSLQVDYQFALQLERNKFPERIEEEIRALIKLARSPHENIVKYIESFTEGSYQYIVLEYCEYGDLRKYLHRYKLSDRQGGLIIALIVCLISSKCWTIRKQRLVNLDNWSVLSYKWMICSCIRAVAVGGRRVVHA